MVLLLKHFIPTFLLLLTVGQSIDLLDPAIIREPLGQVPLCTASGFKVDYTKDEVYTYKSDGFNTKQTFILEPGWKCQFPIDGVNSEKIRNFLIPA